MKAIAQSGQANICFMFRINNGLKQGDDLSPFPFNVVLEYAIRRVQVNQDDMKLNGTHQLLLIYWAEAYIL